MPRLPALEARDFIKAAKNLGYVYEKTKGSHFIFRRPTDGKHLSIPVHKGKDLGRGMSRSLIRDMGITVDEFLKLL